MTCGQQRLVGCLLALGWVCWRMLQDVVRVGDDSLADLED